MVDRKWMDSIFWTECE